MYIYLPLSLPATSFHPSSPTLHPRSPSGPDCEPVTPGHIQLHCTGQPSAHHLLDRTLNQLHYRGHSWGQLHCVVCADHCLSSEGGPRRTLQLQCQQWCGALPQQQCSPNCTRYCRRPSTTHHQMYCRPATPATCTNCTSGLIHRQTTLHTAELLSCDDLRPPPPPPPPSVPPTVQAVQGRVVGIQEMSVTLTFTISDASPEVQTENIQWTFKALNGSSFNIPTYPITNNSLYTTFSNVMGVFSSDRLSLILSGLTNDFEGTYTMTATNEAGSDSATVEMVIEGQRHCSLSCF